MAQDKTFSIGIATTADTRGVEETVRSINLLTDKVSVSEFGFYDLGAEIKKTTAKNEDLASGIRQTEKPVRNTSMAILDLSRGLEDAQYGIRGVLNNIPSFVMSMGGTAGIAGAVSIAAVSISTLVDWFGATTQSAKETTEKIDELSNKIGRVQEGKLTKVRDEINKAAEEAQRLQQNWEETTKADNSYTVANLENQAKVKAAAITINELLGQRINKLNELAQKEADEAAKRQELAKQQVEDEVKKLSRAEEAVARQEIRLTDLQTENEKTRQLLDSKKNQILELQAQLVAMNKAATQEISPYNMGPGASLNKIDFQARSDAQGNIGSVTSRVEILQKQVESIRSVLEKDDASLRSAAVTLEELQNRKEDIANAVATKTQEIVQNFEAENIVSSASSAVDRTKEIVDVLKNSFGQIQTNNQSGIEAKTNLSKALEDGKITQQEMLQITRDMVTLIGLIQSGQASSKESVSTLAATQRDLNANFQSLNEEVKRISGLVSRFNGN